MTVYRPAKQCAFFISDFSELLSIIHTNYDKIIILSDFNLHVDNQCTANEQLTSQNCMNFYTPEPLFLHEEILEKFVLVDAETLGKFISQLKPATYFLDPIPTSFFKNIL